MAGNPLKILLIGPCRAGKTAIGNFLSERAEQPSPEYIPTAGVRILEFDAQTHSAQSWKGGRESIELWDCSGDKRYEGCAQAIKKGAVGVILIYNPDDSQHLAELKYWCAAQPLLYCWAREIARG